MISKKMTLKGFPYVRIHPMPCIVFSHASGVQDIHVDKDDHMHAISLYKLCLFFQTLPRLSCRSLY